MLDEAALEDCIASSMAARRFDDGVAGWMAAAAARVAAVRREESFILTMGAQVL